MRCDECNAALVPVHSIRWRISGNRRREIRFDCGVVVVVGLLTTSALSRFLTFSLHWLGGLGAGIETRDLAKLCHAALCLHTQLIFLPPLLPPLSPPLLHLPPATGPSFVGILSRRGTDSPVDALRCSAPLRGEPLLEINQ